jgi:hypothetical protein
MTAASIMLRVIDADPVLLVIARTTRWCWRNTNTHQVVRAHGGPSLHRHAADLDALVFRGMSSDEVARASTVISSLAVKFATRLADESRGSGYKRRRLMSGTLRYNARRLAPLHHKLPL